MTGWARPSKHSRVTQSSSICIYFNGWYFTGPRSACHSAESLFWLSDLRPPSPQKKWQYAHWMLMCAWPTFTWSFRTNYSLGKITCTLTANWRKVTYKLLEPRAELDCNIWIFGDKIERCDCHDYLSTFRSSSHSTLISCCTWCRLLFSVSLIHFRNFIYFVLV